jgi:hypothetical protein
LNRTIEQPDNVIHLCRFCDFRMQQGLQTKQAAGLYLDFLCVWQGRICMGQVQGEPGLGAHGVQ